MFYWPEVVEEFSPGFQPDKRELSARRFDGSMVFVKEGPARRDGTIVARHEVPG
jgi:hypothetical protein